MAELGGELGLEKRLFSSLKNPSGDLEPKASPKEHLAELGAIHDSLIYNIPVETDTRSAALSSGVENGSTSSGGRLGVVELFAGAAGLAQGFLETGAYDVIALNDVDAGAEITVKANYPDIAYLRKDVDLLRPAELLEVADGRQIAGLLGGPPCQGFSLNGTRNPSDDRNRYVRDYVSFVRALLPDFLVIENVPQLFFRSQFHDMKVELEQTYEIACGVLNAAEYGAPQTRHRAIVVGFHRRLSMTPELPAPTHGFVGDEYFSYSSRRLVQPTSAEEAEGREVLGADTVLRKPTWLRPAVGRMLSRPLPLVTVSDALSDLAGLQAGTRSNTYSTSAVTKFQQHARRRACDLKNHVSRRHDIRMLELISQVPEGGGLADVSRKLWPRSHFSQAYGRLHRRGLARTITTFFSNPGSGRFTHPVDQRAITIREAARLQGFPDFFEFFGGQEQQMGLVGNAVPLSLAAAIGRSVAAQLKQAAGAVRECQDAGLHPAGKLLVRGFFHAAQSR